MPSVPLYVIAIGADTGGLCLAQGLRQAGISVAVYERDQTCGGGLLATESASHWMAIRALRDCLPPKLFDTYIATTTKAPLCLVTLTEQPSEILSYRNGFNGSNGYEDPANGDFSVSRMTLRQVLLTSVEDAVYFDQVFSRYEKRDDGKAIAFFVDTTSGIGNILVAADGANSRVRRQYLPQAKLLDSGLIGIAGKVPMTTDTKKLLPERSSEGIKANRREVSTATSLLYSRNGPAYSTTTPVTTSCGASVLPRVTCLATSWR